MTTLSNEFIESIGDVVDFFDVTVIPHLPVRSAAQMGELIIELARFASDRTPVQFKVRALADFLRGMERYQFADVVDRVVDISLSTQPPVKVSADQLASTVNVSAVIATCSHGRHAIAIIHAADSDPVDLLRAVQVKIRAGCGDQDVITTRPIPVADSVAIVDAIAAGRAAVDHLAKQYKTAAHYRPVLVDIVEKALAL